MSIAIGFSFPPAELVVVFCQNKRPAEHPRGAKNGAIGFGAFCPGGSGLWPEQPRLNESRGGLDRQARFS